VQELRGASGGPRGAAGPQESVEKHWRRGAQGFWGLWGAGRKGPLEAVGGQEGSDVAAEGRGDFYNVSHLYWYLQKIDQNVKVILSLG
jgi:hypothetical protein